MVESSSAHQSAVHGQGCPGMVHILLGWWGCGRCHSMTTPRPCCTAGSVRGHNRCQPAPSPCTLQVAEGSCRAGRRQLHCDAAEQQGLTAVCLLQAQPRWPASQGEGSELLLTRGDFSADVVVGRRVACAIVAVRASLTSGIQPRRDNGCNRARGAAAQEGGPKRCQQQVQNAPLPGICRCGRCSCCWMAWRAWALR